MNSNFLIDLALTISDSFQKAILEFELDFHVFNLI
jgi:hypothetical protein